MIIELTKMSLFFKGLTKLTQLTALARGRACAHLCAETIILLVSRARALVCYVSYVSYVYYQ